jgi:hypothetical protein
MAASPTVASSPTVSLLDWDEAAVQAFLANVLQMPQYEELIYGESIGIPPNGIPPPVQPEPNSHPSSRWLGAQSANRSVDRTNEHTFIPHPAVGRAVLTLRSEHGITGDVLAEMEHTALADMGITSLGHRLKLLRAVWEIKKEQGVQMGEDDWKPAGEFAVALQRYVLCSKRGTPVCQLAGGTERGIWWTRVDRADKLLDAPAEMGEGGHTNISDRLSDVINELRT